MVPRSRACRYADEMRLILEDRKWPNVSARPPGSADVPAATRPHRRLGHQHRDHPESGELPEQPDKQFPSGPGWPGKPASWAGTRPRPVGTFGPPTAGRTVPSVAGKTRLGGQPCPAGAVTARGTIGATVIATVIATVMDPATGTGHHPASRTRPLPGAAGAPATSRTASKTSRKNLLTFAANSRNCATQKHVSPERITTPVTYASQVAATSNNRARRSRRRSPGVVPAPDPGGSTCAQRPGQALPRDHAQVS